jgi:hypothetical protein
MRSLVGALALGTLVLAVLAGPAEAANVLRVPADFPTIQAAIDAAAPGDTVLVSPATYSENISFNGKDVTVKSTSGPASTTLDAHGSTGVQIGPGGTLEGFTVENGAAFFGAGMAVSGNGSLIRGNIFQNNMQFGGGFGAAIAGNFSSPTIEENLFRHNSCDAQFISGVVAFVNFSSPVIQNNVFADNPCRAINMTLPSGSAPVVIDNTIVRNAAGVRVDGRIPSADQVYRNNVIVANDVGLVVDFGNPPTWDHNLVYGNGTNYGGIADQTGLNGNISADPLFVNSVAGDFHLQAGSPAIDAGSNALAPLGDFDGVTRPQDGNGDGVAVFDIGAFEFVNPVLQVSIDIKPGETPNPIQPASNGTIPVGIVSTTKFSAASQVDTTSLKFGHSGNEASLASCSPPQDLNRDGLPDLLCRFYTQKTGFQTGDTQGILTGKTVSGTSIKGIDSIAVVPPN